MKKMRTRQVHLDFHTSEAIQGIGKDFSKEQFQQMLKLGHLSSITVFSKCHHGWAYHPSKANEIHPHLDFDLLGSQIEAAHEIGVNTPVYISAGLDEKMARRYPQWLIRNKDESTTWVADFMTPGYHQFCFNTPYLDYLLEQVKEVVTTYDVDGIFLDIVGVRECYCTTCTNKAIALGIDPRNKEEMQPMWEETYNNYTKKVREVVDEYKPGTPIFHNGGHIRRGRRDQAYMNTHLELESLPTGGWGYQHFPISARYVQGLNMQYLGMTGKFHNTWGEFGGYKHPNALKWEASLCIANGSNVSIGDQLHPEGIMDNATYALIGEAYKEVEAKEEWCFDVNSISDVGVLSVESVFDSGADDKNGSQDEGCVKLMLEGKYLFDMLDMESDFNKYKVIVLPDVIRIDSALKTKLAAFTAAGGKILATGKSGLCSTTDEFAFDFGAKYIGESEYNPAYIRPNFDIDALENSSFVMYSQGENVELTSGFELAEYQNSYFNRDVYHFCSHQHTPSDLKRFSTGMSSGTDGIYIAWQVFDEYNRLGSYTVKQVVLRAMDILLDNTKTLETNLPAQGIVTLMHQKEQKRYVQHSLYATPVYKGKETHVQVIEDILPVYDTTFEISLDETIKKVYLAPQMKELDFAQTKGKVTYTISKFQCHQMVVMDY